MTWQTYESKRRGVVYGPPGSGKTTLLHTVEGSLWVIDFDRQLKSLLTAWEKAGRKKDDLGWVTVNTKLPRNEAFDKAKHALFHPPKGYDNYALDCYTTFGLLTTYKTVGTQDCERNYNQSTSTDLMGYVTDYFWQFANQVEVWGAWLWVVMQERWQDINDGLSDPSDWRSKKQQIMPDVASSARVTIPSQCDFVWHVEKGKKLVSGRAVSASSLRTQGSPFIMAKSVGYEHVLKEVEDGDLGVIVRKLGLPPKGGKPPQSGGKTTTTTTQKGKP